MAVKDWSTNESSNSAILAGLTLDGGTMTIPQLDNAFRVMAADIASQLGKVGYKGADIASAVSTDLSTATGWYVNITGVTTIAGFGTVAAGQALLLHFTGALTIVHSGSAIILPGAANIRTAADDTAIMLSEGGGIWRCLCYQRAGRFDIHNETQGSVSGTSVDFTGIPLWARRITIMLNGVSTSGTSPVILQLGDSGGIETSGYLSGSGNIATSTASGANNTAGFQIVSGAASAVRSGALTLTLMNSATFTWICTGVIGDSASTAAGYVGGSKSTSAALTQIRLTTVGASDTFDAGTMNITWE